MKRSVTVTLGGQRLAIRTDADEAYMHELAGVVDRKLKQFRSARAATTDSAALMAALSLADDLYREREEQRDFRRKVREKSRSILDYVKKEAKL